MHGGPGGENAEATGDPCHASEVSPAGALLTIRNGSAASIDWLTPNTAAAVEFLRIIATEGPWVLTAIAEDGRTGTRTFRPSLERQLVDWIAQQNGAAKRNVYFMVAEPLRDLAKKAAKQDVARSRWLWADLDPRAREPLEQEKARAVALLADRRPQDVPEPTLVVDSGGGMQAFWRLAEPLADLVELEARNRWLARKLEADGSCWNMDRVMRLPGTVNWPNAKKRRKGRVAALARLCEGWPERTYPAAAFGRVDDQPAAAPMAGRTASPTKPRALWPDDLDLSRLTEVARDRVSAVAVHGPTPEHDFGGDRSKAVHYVACELVRAGVPDEQIAGLLLNPELGIHAHIRDQKGDRLKYVVRQVDQAREAVAKEPAETGSGGDFERGKEGQILATQPNLRLALAKLGVAVSHNRFADRPLIEGPDGQPQRYLGDREIDDLYLQIDERFRFRPAMDFFQKVITTTAWRAGFHPVLDYLDGLSWDGTPRLGRWLVSYGRAEDSEYVRTVGELVLVAAVRRVRRPGAKFDEMLVLEGEQGKLKSTALAVLAVKSDWFSDDLPLNADSKTVIERLAGKWIVEAGELKGMRKGDIDNLKSFLSRQTDRARLAYGRMASEVKRSCVIVGTTNNQKYLKDQTGNRRFWPVRVDQFDLAALAADRDQLWAEAVERERRWQGDVRLPAELWAVAAAQQEERRMADGVELELEQRLAGCVGKVRCTDVYDLLRVRMEARTQEWLENVTSAMARLGWEKTKLRFDGSPPAWCYAKGTKADRMKMLKACFGEGGMQLVAAKDTNTLEAERQAEAERQSAMPF